MICLAKGQEPTVLTQNGASWTAEYLRWHLNRNGNAPRHYAHPDIRSALRVETHAKCAYCEGRINDVAYDNIEHKLPKSKFPELACSWENLTIACPKCNTNKGDYDNPSCRVLDPYVDDVEHQLAFGGPLALPRGGPRASATVNLLDLNRMELLYSRGQALTGINRLLDMIERAAGQPDLVESLWIEIDQLLDEKEEFTSACRQFVAWQMAERGLARGATHLVAQPDQRVNEPVRTQARDVGDVAEAPTERR